jgi:hypothetical protein
MLQILRNNNDTRAILVYSWSRWALPYLLFVADSSRNLWPVYPLRMMRAGFANANSRYHVSGISSTELLGPRDTYKHLCYIVLQKIIKSTWPLFKKRISSNYWMLMMNFIQALKRRWYDDILHLSIVTRVVQTQIAIFTRGINSRWNDGTY